MKLGFALQLVTVRWLGTFLDDPLDVPATRPALRRRCRSEKVERVVASGCRRFDDDFAATTAARLGPVVCGPAGRAAVAAERAGRAEVRPGGRWGLDTLLAEIGKLSTVRALGLDGTVFGGSSDRIVAAWRARAARMYPLGLRRLPGAGAVRAAGDAVLDAAGRSCRR